LNGINNESGQARIAVREPHVLLHTKVDGDSLSFEVKRLRGSITPMDFSVELTAHDHAKIRCLNCGDDAPNVEISKHD
ncbi:MAG TPA: hypothetical protein VL135_12070, partial [Terracidiphilus sp.]|nr:hypothetical protein [Terracidiphilus sp.]